MAGTNPSIPQDMRDLLIRLDQRVSDGFQNVNDKLDAINRRTDDIDGRVRKLEESNTSRQALVGRFETMEKTVSSHEGRFQQLEGAGKGAGIIGKVGTAAMGAGVAALAMMGWQIGLHPKEQVKARTTVETTTTLPVPLKPR